MLNKRKVSAYILGGILLLSLTPCFASDIFSQFTSYAKQTQADWKVPGMAVAIVENGQIVYAKGFGERNAKGDPVTPETIFDIASLTKSFTAALLALQIDEGKYTWNTKVVTLYPDFKLYDSNTTEEFEVRDLIAHDSGLPEGALGGLGNFGYSTDESIYALRFIKPVTPFRSEFAYQDIFLEFAKKIIQQSSGENYVANLHEHLFSPLHMNDSYARTEVNILDKLKNRAQPFLYYDGKNYPYSKSSPYLSQMWALEPGVAGGGIQSSAMDIAKWLIFNINNGAVNNTQLISVKNMNFIHSPQTIIKTSSDGQIEQAYGEGWFIDDEEYKPYTVLYHMGGGTGMHALMAYIPEKKIGIVILTNQYTNQVPEILYRKFFDLYLNKKPIEDWNKIYLEENKQEIAKENLTSQSDQCQIDKSANLIKYVGTYFNPVYGNLNISHQGNHLSLSIGPQSITWELSYCQNDVLKAYWPNPNGMNVPMLPDDGQDLVFFEEDSHNNIQTMIIPFLNDDGSGTFVKE